MASSKDLVDCVRYHESRIPLDRKLGSSLFRTFLCPRVSSGALALLLAFADPSAAQEAQVWFGTAPLSAPSTTPVFTLNVVESPKRPAPTMPSVTVVETAQGPRMSNLALKLPSISIADREVASQLGDQTLPRTFSSSPWTAGAVKRPMRGLSFSTAGTAPVTLLFGQLDASSAPPQSGTTPGVVALTMGVTSSKELSVTPRALVPVGSKTTQSSVGTAIRAEVNRHVSLVSDVGAAATTQQGWDPLGAAGVVGHWSGAEVETNVLRGTSPVSASDIATAGSIDREIVRGLVRSIPGMTISTQASWSRPASAPATTDTTVRSIGVAYDRLPIGVLTTRRQDEDSSWQQAATTSVEWRRKPAEGIVVRYTKWEQTLRDSLQPTVVSNQVELEFPGWIERDFRNRLDVHAVLTDSPTLGTPTVSSKLSGRFDIIRDVGVTGNTEIGISRSGPTLREFRVASKVPILQRTAVQLVYTYQGRGPYSLVENQSFEARLLRSASLVSW
jgi:hypothetical protein